MATCVKEYSLATDSGEQPGDEYLNSVTEFRSELVAYFIRRIRAPEEAEDLAHEVMVRLLRRRGERRIAALRPYLYETARTVLIDWARRNSVRCKGSHEPLSDSIPDADSSFERALITRQDMECVRSALMELSSRTRNIFLLRRVEGLKHHEIAGNLGVSLSTVEKHDRIATLHLRGYLESRA